MLKSERVKSVNFVAMGQTVAEMWSFFDLSKMASVCHLAFVMRVFRQPTSDEGHFVVFIKVQNLVGIDTVVSVICKFQYYACELGLKTPIQAAKIGVLPEKWGTAWAWVPITQCRLAEIQVQVLVLQNNV